MHNMLPQIEKQGEFAFFKYHTGEMIAKYYDPNCGGITSNSFDSCGKAWHFWSDCSNPEE